MIPPGIDPRRLLVVVDASWWLTKAFILGGPEGMAAIVVGWLVDLLSGECPAALAFALDSSGPTWRHRRTEGLPPERQYKAQREPRPQEYYAVSRRILELVHHHAIPIWWAEGYEADDVIASAVRQAVPHDLDVAILSADKDLAALVRDAGDGIPSRVVRWDGRSEVLDEAGVQARWGVLPHQVPDLLAIVGDKADNVAGVRGLGWEKAARLVARFGSAENALTTTPCDVPTLDARIKEAEREASKLKRQKADASAITSVLTGLREERAVAKDLIALQAAADDVRLALELVTLDPSAPVELDVQEIPVGGYDVDRIRDAYDALGFTAKAREVCFVPKTPIDPEQEAPVSAPAPDGEAA